MSKTYTDVLIEKIYRDKWMIRFITQARDMYGFWSWGELINHYKNQLGKNDYQGMSLTDPRIELKKLNDMIAGL
jgi:hypothetical protein